MHKSTTIREMVLSRIIYEPNGCWRWVGTIDCYGYGRIKFNGRQHKAHRVSFEEFAAPIPDGLEIDHLCRNRACVNPKHLEPVTHAENMARVVFPASGQCPAGHDLTLPNARITRRKGKGRGECRLCHNARVRAHEKRKAALSAG